MVHNSKLIIQTRSKSQLTFETWNWILNRAESPSIKHCNVILRSVIDCKWPFIMRSRSSSTATRGGDVAIHIIVVGDEQVLFKHADSCCHLRNLCITFSNGEMAAVVSNRFASVQLLDNHANAFHARMPIARRCKSALAPGSTDDAKYSDAGTEVFASSKSAFMSFSFCFECIISNPRCSTLWYANAHLGNWCKIWFLRKTNTNLRLQINAGSMIQRANKLQQHT